MADVFISYSRGNEPVVHRLADAVKRLGYSVWWDDELPPHLSCSDVITDKIGAARAAIVVWSEGAASSERVRAEADVARAQKKLIQTSIDGRMPPMPFNQIQCAAIGDWHGEDDHPGWLKVKASLEALCGPPGENMPPPIAQPPPARPTALPPQAGRAALLVPVLLGLLLLAVLIVACLLWSQGTGNTPPPRNQAAAPAAPTAPAPPAKPSAQAAPTPPPEAPAHRPAARPAQAPAAAPAQAPKPAAAATPQVLTMPFNPRRYCAGPGRDTAECAQLRERFGRPRLRGR